MDSDEEELEDIVESMSKNINAFIMRRKLNREAEDMEEVDEKYKPGMQIVFWPRKWEGRPPYEMSPWGRMLRDCRTKDPSDRKGGKLFRRRFT
jgi:hypothetical protein